MRQAQSLCARKCFASARKQVCQIRNFYAMTLLESPEYCNVTIGALLFGSSSVLQYMASVVNRFHDAASTTVVPEEKVSILGDNCNGHSKQKCIYTCILFRTGSEMELFDCTVVWIWRPILSFLPVCESVPTANKIFVVCFH
jgi:hypothetical protein